ncbi:MAG: hypothetical protein ACYC61_12615 [Isosphaeraceae bacterium]
MPVIRGRPTTRALTRERRADLKERLAGELSGRGTPDGPLIFEIPLEQSDRFDAIVVWNEFAGARAEDRDQVILEAYGDLGRRPSMAMGVTDREADDRNLLPYLVVSKTEVLAAVEDDSVDPADLHAWHNAMIEEGGIVSDGGAVALRFPTRTMAEDAQARLASRFPGARWSISTRLDSIP